MIERLRQLLTHPRVSWIAAAAAVVLSLPTVLFGLLADDYLHRARVLGDPAIPAVENVTLRFFEFIPGTAEGNAALADLGLLPWWVAPGLQASFFRPLAAWTHLADYLLWPAQPWLMHVHSLLWLAAAVVAVALLYRRVHGFGVVAGLAALLFALEDAHAGPAGWIANRNALIALAFAAAALGFHDRWRRRRWTAGAVLAPGAFAVALAAGEAALGIGGYLAAHALLLDRGRWWKRAASLLPYAALTLGWLWFYRAADFGTAGSDMYVEPLGAPLAFAQAVVERVPVLLLNQFTPLVCDPWVALPTALQWTWSAVGAVAIGALLWIWRPVLRDRPVARFWALGMVLSLLPVCAAFPMDRLLLFCGIGGAGLLACAAEWGGWPGRTRRGGRAHRGAVVALLVVHLGLAPVLKPLRAVPLYATLGPFEVAARQAPSEPAVAGQDLVFVNGVLFLVGYVPVIRSVEGGVVPAGQDFLLHVLDGATLTRVDEVTLRAERDGGLLARRTQQLGRSPRFPFTPGETIRRRFMTVTVEAVTPDGRPDAVTFRFDVPLEDPSLRWLIWQRGELHEFTPPAVGEAVRTEPTLPPAPLAPWAPERRRPRGSPTAPATGARSAPSTTELDPIAPPGGS